MDRRTGPLMDRRAGPLMDADGTLMEQPNSRSWILSVVDLAVVWASGPVLWRGCGCFAIVSW